MDDKEDKLLSQKYDNRLDLPEEEWIELPPDKSDTDFYQELKKQNTKLTKEDLQEVFSRKHSSFLH